MKGVLFKYDADPNDPELRDNQSACSSTICGIRDPDFLSNEVPVWGICGPHVRQNLKKGDMLFFMLKKWSWEKAGLKDYICTGIIVVDKILPSIESVLVSDLLSYSYKKEWKNDLDSHLRKDKPSTKKIRGNNFIIGDQEQSIWLGRHENYIRESLKKAGFKTHIKKLSQRKIPYLRRNAIEKLYQIITS
jgi:hypothetical protein